MAQDKTHLRLAAGPVRDRAFSSLASRLARGAPRPPPALPRPALTRRAHVFIAPLVTQVTPEQRKAAQEAKALGNKEFVAGQFDAAAKHFTAAIENDPTDHVFFSNRSACYASVGKLNAAIEDAEKCVELKPDWGKGYSRLGLALFKKGDLAGAQKAYSAGLACDPNNVQCNDGLAETRARKELLAANADRAAKDMANLEAMAPEDRYVVGIDLGTTYSCVSVWKDGEAQVLANAEGDRTTPSWVAFTDDGRLVGDSAKRQAAQNTKRTLFNVKRIIGRDFSECAEEIKIMPFDVIEGDGGKPLIQVEVDDEKKTFSPEQVSAMVLEKMKKTAEVALGCTIKKAVITVPAYFNDAQKRQTKDAGAIAGLDVLRIINEPTAAALAYGLDKKGTEDGVDAGAEAVARTAKKQNILVFDLGGGTFDVSLLNIEDGVFKVLSTAGDTHLGGEDFDTKLAEDVAAQHLKKSGEDIFTGDDKAQRKLRTACERAKRMLSSSTGATIEAFIGDHEINMPYTRARFEKVCEPLFLRCLESVKRVLDDAKMKKTEIDEIVLVGGSTRVPRVQTLLSEYFDGKTLNKSVHPDEAVAYGAAVQGAILSGVRDSATANLLLVDVIPLSLGIEVEGKSFAKVVPRNTPVPCKKKQEFTTVYDYQDEIDVRIFEGERSNTDGNHLLGEFQITGVERAKKGEPKIDVQFEVNTNGLLTVTARDRETGANAEVKLQHDRGRLTPEEIARMCAEAEAMRAEDERAEREFEAAMERGEA
jgi:L1 cell adhesion molecule like protein